MNLQEILPVLTGYTRTVYIACKATNDPNSLAKAIASLLPQPVYLFHLQDQYLRSGEGKQLLTPLMAGETVLLLYQGDLPLPAEFVDGWTEYTEHPPGQFMAIARDLRLEPNATLTNPGFLAVVHITPNTQSPRPRKVGGYCLLEPDEVATLEVAGKSLTYSITHMGAPPHPGSFSITMKDLCLLHTRDPQGTVRLPLGELLKNESQNPFTWTDLQELMYDGSVQLPILDFLHKRGRIDDEKWSYGQAAFDYLDKRMREGPRAWDFPVYESIYHVVWFYDWLNKQPGFVFRGQSNIRWRQDSSLFRSTNGSLDVQTLLERAQLTQAFLDALKAHQLELFGAELRNDELLAIAQHYGFPTPLLDYTRSFCIAAFFATRSAARLKPGDERIGIIYYTKLQQRQQLMNDPYIGRFSLLHEARIHLGSLRVIEPKIPDADNRIARQQGVFLEGYQVRDLQNISNEYICFRQQAGEVFEDPATGITEQHLLSDQSKVYELADEVVSRFQKPKLHPTMGAARIPESTIIGSTDEHLFEQVLEAQSFFASLRQSVEQSASEDLLETLGDIFITYFQTSQALANVKELPADNDNQQALANVKELPADNDNQQALNPFEIALSQLAMTCNMDSERLRDTVQAFLPQKFMLTYSLAALPRLQTVPTSDSERIALACALYLAGWEHLKHVGGEEAKGLALSAVRVLSKAVERYY